MTDEQWLAATDPQVLLEYLGPRADGRRLRLFLAVCFRQVWEFIEDPRTREAIAAGELFADGLIDEAARAAAEASLWEARWDYYMSDVEYAPDLEAAFLIVNRQQPEARQTGSAAAALLSLAMYGEAGFEGLDSELRIEQCYLLREVFGGLLRPVAFYPSWRTADAVGVVRGMFEAGDFTAVPILADALQEAGCDNSDILDHCRGLGPHIRGCWVVDLVLGKE